MCASWQRIFVDLTEENMNKRAIKQLPQVQIHNCFGSINVSDTA